MGNAPTGVRRERHDHGQSRRDGVEAYDAAAYGSVLRGVASFERVSLDSGGSDHAAVPDGDPRSTTLDATAYSGSAYQ